MERPSNFWYLAYIGLGIIAGLICYLIWKDKNTEAAKKHLIHSLIITIIVMIVPFLILIPLGLSE